MSSELLAKKIIELVKWSVDGLVPTVVQDSATDEVLMMAWVNVAALNTTVNSGLATYWSRSRQELWTKGATSGNTQAIRSISIDCDGDTLLYKVWQTGVACHTGNKSCFTQEIFMHE